LFLYHVYRSFKFLELGAGENQTNNENTIEGNNNTNILHLDLNADLDCLDDYNTGNSNDSISCKLLYFYGVFKLSF